MKKKIKESAEGITVFHLSIDGLAEADAFVKMFSDSLKNPPKPLNEVECSTISREQMTKIINARLDGKKITTKYNESLNCSQ